MTVERIPIVAREVDGDLETKVEVYAGLGADRSDVDRIESESVDGLSFVASDGDIVGYVEVATEIGRVVDWELYPDYTSSF